MTYRFLSSAVLQISGRLLLLLLSIVLARSLGADGFGIYAYAMAVLGVLTMLAQFGVPQYFLREVARQNFQEQHEALVAVIACGYRLVAGLSLLISVAGAAVLVAVMLAGSGYHIDQLLTFSALLLLIPLNVLCSTTGNVLRSLDHLTSGQLVEIVLRPLIVLLLAGGIFLLMPDFRQPQIAMLIQLFACAAVLVLGLFLISNAIRLREVIAHQPSAHSMRTLFRIMIPFASASFALALNSQADILILGIWRSAEEVGIYRIASQSALLVAFFLQVVTIIVIPRFVELHGQQRRNDLARLLTKSVRYVFTATLPLALILILAGEPIISFVFGASFRDVAIPMAILALGQLLTVAFGFAVTLLMLTGHEQESARILWIAVFVNVAANMLLVPLFGATGAACGTVLSLALWNGLLWRVLKQKLGYDSTLLGRHGYLES